MGDEVRVAVLGGGVAGVVLAHELSRDPRFRIDLVERDSRLGGLHRSVLLGGVAYDIGAFAFEESRGLLHSFPSLQPLFMKIKYVRKSLTSRGSLDAYPLSLRGYARDHGFSGLCLAAADLAISKARYWKRDSFASFVRYYLGDRLYRGSGLKHYVERFYCAGEDEIDLEFARQRLVVMEQECSLRRAALRAVTRPFGVGARLNAWREWVAWVRPQGGFGVVYQAVRGILESRGVSVLTGRQIGSIAREGGEFVIDFPDETRRYHRVVSTIPVPAALRYVGLPPRAGGAIEYMKLYSLFFRFTGDPGHDAAVLYNFTSGGRWKRLAAFSNLYGTVDGEHYFVVECTLPPGDGSSLEEQARGFEEHISRAGLFRGELRYQGGVVTEEAYPIYRNGKLGEIAEMRQLLNRAGIDTVGRQGRFEYISSSVAAERSIELVSRMRAGMA
jgi:phytoene dehydrogenase-like protein